MVHSRSPSQLTPDASRAPFPQRSPPRLLTAAACGGLQPPPAGRLRRATPPSPAQHRPQQPELPPRTASDVRGHTGRRVLENVALLLQAPHALSELAQL